MSDKKYMTTQHLKNQYSYCKKRENGYAMQARACAQEIEKREQEGKVHPCRGCYGKGVLPPKETDVCQTQCPTCNGSGVVK